MVFLCLASLIINGNFNYISYSLDTVKNYQYVMSIPFSLNKHLLLLIFPTSLIFLLYFLLCKTKITFDTKKIFILLTIIALLQLKSAFIRMDDGHIISGIYPSILVVFLILFVLFQQKIKVVFIFLFLFSYLLIPYKNNYFQVISIQNILASLSLIQTSQPFLTLYRLSDNYYFSNDDFKMFESIIMNNPGQVMVYPYDSYVLNIFGQTFNTLGLQMYQYSNSLVEKKTVEQLRKSPPNFIILGIDDRGATRLDNIPNFSRNPQLTKWMIKNYSVDKKADNYLILRFNPEKQKKTVDKHCKVYEIDTTEIMQNNIFENIFKASTYYLETDTGPRLPYMPNTNKILFIEQFNNAKNLQAIFENDTYFETYNTEKKQLKIIKKYPTPKSQKTFERTQQVKCYL